MAVFRLFASLRVTVVCLLVLAVLVFWGTLYQIDYGLYAAQQRFYQSWYFITLGVVPFPGTQLVLTVLFLNLFAAMLTHFRYGWRYAGVVLIHAGLLLLLGGGFVTRQHAQEGFLMLFEGEGSNVAASYHEWELSVWQGTDGRRNVVAADADGLASGDRVSFDAPPLTVTVEKYFGNSRPLAAVAGDETPRSTLGAGALEKVALEKEPEANIPGGIFLLSAGGRDLGRFLLYGADAVPAEVQINGSAYQVSLRRKRYPLPLTVRLLDFRKEHHPNSDIARSYSSTVELTTPGGLRGARIEMNKPLRYRGFTLYQASFTETQDGKQASTFAVVKNYGRLLPYVASVLTFMGLLAHFLIVVASPRPIEAVV